MKTKLKVVNINSKTVFREVLDEIIKADDENLVTDCVILCRRKYREEEKKKNIEDGILAEGKLIRYWFGEENTMNFLGMITHMQFVLSNYVEGIDLLNEEEE